MILYGCNFSKAIKRLEALICFQFPCAGFPFPPPKVKTGTRASANQRHLSGQWHCPLRAEQLKLWWALSLRKAQRTDGFVVCLSVFPAAPVDPFKVALLELLEKGGRNWEGCLHLPHCCVLVGQWRKACPNDLVYSFHPLPRPLIALRFSPSTESPVGMN